MVICTIGAKKKRKKKNMRKKYSHMWVNTARFNFWIDGCMYEWIERKMENTDEQIVGNFIIPFFFFLFFLFWSAINFYWFFSFPHLDIQRESTNLFALKGKNKQNYTNKHIIFMRAGNQFSAWKNILSELQIRHHICSVSGCSLLNAFIFVCELHVQTESS